MPPGDGGIGRARRGLIPATTFLFAPVGVASEAVAKVSDALFLVFFGNLALIVAGVAVKGSQRAGMAIAAASRPAVVHGETVRTIVIDRHPGGGVVTGTAIRQEQASMNSRFCVARLAFGRCSAVSAAVAARAGQAGVRPGQREARARVVKGDVRPVVGLVTGCAVRTKLPVVMVIPGVTGYTGGGRAAEFPARVTGGALHSLVRAGQGEG